MKNIIIFIFIFIIFILLFYIYNIYTISCKISSYSHSEYIKYNTYSNKIPNVIYTYWHTEEKPKLVQKCINSWKRHNPTYKIIVLSKNNIRNYIPFDIDSLRFANTQQQKSDFIRIYLLSKNGGIWLDSTIYLNQSLDWINAYQYNENSEFIGYKINGFTQLDNSPVVENWFMACIPNSIFMNDWKNTFYSINAYNTIDDYVNSIKLNTDIQKIYNPHYLTMHIACQYILQNSENKNFYKLSLLEAEKGPYLYLDKMNWNNFYLIPIIIIHKAKESPVIKYRSCERSIIEKYNLTVFID